MWDKNNRNSISSSWDKHQEYSSSPLDVFKVIDRSYLEWLKKQAGSWIQQKQIDSIISHVNEHTTLTENDIKIIWWNLYICGVHTSDSISPTIDTKRNKYILLKNPEKVISFWYVDLFNALVEFTNKISTQKFDNIWLDFSEAVLSIPDDELMNTLSTLTEHNKEFLAEMKSLFPNRELMIPFAVNNGKDVIYCMLQNSQQEFQRYHNVSHLPQSSKLES